MGVQYKMRKEMYDGIRFQKIYNKETKSFKKGKTLTKQEVLKYVNDTFGLNQDVTEIVTY